MIFACGAILPEDAGLKPTARSTTKHGENTATLNPMLLDGVIAAGYIGNPVENVYQLA